jgi:hypothetical protein
MFGMPFSMSCLGILKLRDNKNTRDVAGVVIFGR